MFKYLSVLLISTITAISGTSQQNTTKGAPGIIQYQMEIHRGFIFAHSKDVQNTAGAKPFGFQIERSVLSIDESSWNKCSCYPKTGWVLQYFNYDSKILGHGVNFFYILEPYFTYHNTINFSMRAAAGAGWGSNPYHPVSNPANQSYSLPISGKIALSLGIHHHFTQNLQVSIYGNYNHISNGGIKEPNKGINWPTLSISATYSPGSDLVPLRERTKPGDSGYTGFKSRIYSFISSKTISSGEKNRWMLFGAGYSLSRQVGKINAISIGTELWYDFALMERMSRDAIEGKSSWRSGILIGHEFLMGRFTFSQSLGVYTFKQTPYYDPVYQRYGLEYFFNKSVSAGMNVLAHRNEANFLDLRICLYI